jgi:hypothetical protein
MAAYRDHQQASGSDICIATLARHSALEHRRGFGTAISALQHAAWLNRALT